MKKCVFPLCLILFLSFFTLFPETGNAADGDITLTLTVPTAANSTIASGRSFSVQGTLGTANNAVIPEDAVLTITLSDGSGNTVRTLSQHQKNNDNLDVSNPLVSYYDKSDPNREQLKSAGMAEILYDPADPVASLKNGSIKCYYSDTQFRGIIVGATHAAIDDQMNYVDGGGHDYPALADGDYTITASLYANDGSTVLSSDTMKITIGTNPDKVLARFSPSGHFAKVQTWADQMGYTVYNDPFPGYFSQGNVFAEILPMWRAADITEYTAGKVHMVVYNMKASSSSYSVELGYLQSVGAIADPNRFAAYYYDIGEPSLVVPDAGISLTGNIVPFDSGDYLALTRADTVADGTLDNTLNTETPGILATDTDLRDGVTIAPGTDLAIQGVTAPIPLDSADVANNGDNSYTLNNKISTLVYTLDNGAQRWTEEKPVATLNRVDNSDWTTPSELEFSHVLAITDDMAGQSLTVSVQGYDAHGAAVSGTAETFRLSVTGHDPAPTAPLTTRENVPTGTDHRPPVAALSAVMTALFVLVVRRSKTHSES
ncbi:hypothetical protein [Eubacterium barkeri]|uniref:Ig-like domain (Group 3) n=1 Tax=Eubacterium barkeri TaxID=1528 RepID=A0A1H3AGM1_EUBBA|nr:hypothetical protein [Eubacterium barkeri]SDX28745.1 hypothetical protein SAMN04488579_10135 [Eubacterium barkeri]